MYKNSLLIIFLLAFFCQSVSAQICSYSLGDVLVLTLLNNPELNSFDYDMRANEARILQAGMRPNPALDVEVENLNAQEFFQSTFLLSQLIELGGKRKARVKFAQTERDKVSLDYEVKKRQLFVDATLLFIEVLVNQEKILFLEEDYKILQEFFSVVKKHVEAGKASIIEEANFTVLLTTAAMDLQKARNELKNTKYRLAAQWGELNNDLYGIEGNLEWIPIVNQLEHLEELLKTHPQMLRSNIESDLRQARIALEKSKAYPDVDIRAGPRYLNEAHKWVWVVGMSIPIPVNDRNQGRIWESAEIWERLEKEREAIWIKLLTELNTYYSTIQNVFSELNLLKDVILPATQKAYDSSYKGYQIARYNYLELLETQRAYKTSKIRYLQALGEYHKALAVIEGLTGSKAVINLQCESYEK